MITAVEPSSYPAGVSYSANQPIFTIRGNNLDQLPSQILLCSDTTRNEAQRNYNDSSIGGFHTLVVLSRTDTEITFGRSTSVSNFGYKIVPFFITSPNTPPRSIIYEFGVTNRGEISEEER